MEKYCVLVKEQIRHNIGWQTGLSVLLLAGSLLILGIRNLDLAQSAKVLEMYVATIGILLLVPVFQPEQNKDLRDLIASKYTDIRCIYGVRVGISVLVSGILLFVYMGVMRHGNCEMELGKFFFGTMAEMLAFGGIGILAYAWSDNLIVGYMAPIVYYVIAYGGGAKYLKKLYPFAMTTDYSTKYVLLAAGIFCILCGIFIRGKRQR